MKKISLILLLIYFLWKEDFQKFFGTFKLSEEDLLAFLVAEVTSKCRDKIVERINISNNTTDEDIDKEEKNESDDLQTYNRKQVMEILHISGSTLWRYQKNKLLTPRSIGPNHIVFLRSEVDALVNGCSA